MMRLYALPIAALLVSGCYDAELDPSRGGVFACESAADCPEGTLCDNAVCESAEDLPTLEVRSPEDQQTFDFDRFNADGRINVRIAGDMELVSADAMEPHVSGQGHVVVFVDGEKEAVIDEGNLSAGVALDALIERTPGLHRIVAQARRNDGLDYEFEGAQATGLFWLDDGKPHVALVSPWPGETFPPGATDVEFAVATLNFDVIAAGANETVPGRGHVHVHYDDEFPACVQDDFCDTSHFLVLDRLEGDLARGQAILQEDDPGEVQLTAILRNIDHSPYLDPFPTQDMPPPQDITGSIVYDSITITRAEPR